MMNNKSECLRLMCSDATAPQAWTRGCSRRSTPRSPTPASSCSSAPRRWRTCWTPTGSAGRRGRGRPGRGRGRPGGGRGEAHHGWAFEHTQGLSLLCRQRLSGIKSPRALDLEFGMEGTAFISWEAIKLYMKQLQHLAREGLPDHPRPPLVWLRVPAHEGSGSVACDRTGPAYSSPMMENTHRTDSWSPCSITNSLTAPLTAPLLTVPSIHTLQSCPPA